MKLFKRELCHTELFAMLPIMLLIIACIITGILSLFTPKRDPDATYFITTNSLGCSQYEYRGDRFWKCPNHPEITQIEVEYLNGKYYDKKIEPVIK